LADGGLPKNLYNSYISKEQTTGDEKKKEKKKKKTSRNSLWRGEWICANTPFFV
jgi:hypothetical protein